MRETKSQNEKNAVAKSLFHLGWYRPHSTGVNP